MPVKQHLARLRTVAVQHQCGQRGLTAAVVANQCHILALFDLKADILQHRLFGIVPKRHMLELVYRIAACVNLARILRIPAFGRGEQKFALPAKLKECPGDRTETLGHLPNRA